ncbi:MAG: valine--tRNA ligase [Spirochaetales bacterium]|uniref:valine--tRNA ligase n=1 Tax=Bullifex sp. TaxID=2815808 RepID=UPI002A55A7F4|nr:valine--tRNA ligase [Bullifex sp.]MDD5972546.1 valine--tRNA ligase [Spirochaetales bacterium]MDD7270296.1 valine--tRNA ligase [Spirochaetales bacterium]MDY4066211.1 valine--tRNA ligase [Bullifex sp.]
MKAVELSKSYNPKDFEDRIYTQWVDGKCFGPQKEGNEHFSVVMPPPNVTGILHMGHALNNNLQDIIVRYQRMQGKNTLWVPGTDHAGIATQNVVERQLAKEGLRRQDLGREKFIERTWEVKHKHHAIISSQLKKMGCSCDWDHERFTMDEGLSKAVREAFVTLYERGLIYKGKYLVNYCPKCGTALADDEVEYENMPGHLYDVRYPYADGSGYITVATTRPETMFGDVAVAVNPDDERYKDVVGKMLILPLMGKEIPIIADQFVDKEFGTGMVKITPAHDPNDWECGKRHNLEAINLLNPDGTLNENVPEKYRGLDPIKARELVVKDLEEGGYLVGIKDHAHDVGHCYRCHTVVEPYLSEQWFVSMKGMADKALKAWKDGDIQFYPKRWENTYTHWMENIRDWCISRQLWWGHRIPVWYCDDCGEMIVSRTDVDTCPKCGSKHLHQDNDVLDTWFSSWLWPFSTLGWPDKTPDLSTFFPTQTLVSAYDIIFFWISRMIMASEEFMGQAPFKDIVITGLVRDKQGRKMSKSLGNGIDPLEVIDLYGADAMKFTLCYLAAQGQDVQVDMDSFKMGSRFANKIWNATRFLLMNLEGRNLVDITPDKLNTMDKWIYHQLNDAINTINKAMAGYRFNEAAQAVYSFFWNDYCDWYIEASKMKLLRGSDEEKDLAISILMDVLEKSMRLMHPYLSFVTEEIYQKLPNNKGMLISQDYPKFDSAFDFAEESKLVGELQEAVKIVRSVRSKLGIAPEKKLHVVIRPSEGFYATDTFISEKNLMATFMGAGTLEIDTDNQIDCSKAFPSSALGFEVFTFVREAIDVEAEIKKLTAEIEKAEKNLSQSNKKLSNEQFVKNAKKEAIEKERSKKAEFEEVIQKSNEHIALLKTL